MSNLTDVQKQQIVDALLKRKDELRAEIRTELQRAGHEHFADLAGEVADSGDSSMADMLVDKGIAIVSRLVEELAGMEVAEKRLASPEFGECEECGSDIGFERLMAAPYATRCIACQAQHEKTFAHNGAPKL